MVGFFHFAHTRIPCNLNPILWTTQSSLVGTSPLSQSEARKKRSINDNDHELGVKKILFGWNGFSNGTVIFYSPLAQLQFDCLLIFLYFTKSHEDETAFYSQWKSLSYDLNTYHHQNVSIYYRWHQVMYLVLDAFFIIRNLCIMLFFDDLDEAKELSFCTLTQFFTCIIILFLKSLVFVSD